MKSNHDFPKSFLLLQKEGYLISNCLTTGLTELRSATIQQKGRFYVALFNIAVGIERLLKSILIINYMIENSLSVPTKNQLKEYGHNIHELIDSAFKIANIRDIDFSRIKECDEITLKILNLINDFAMTTRYYNLDALSSNTNYRDPLNYINEIYTDRG